MAANSSAIVTLTRTMGGNVTTALGSTPIVTLTGFISRQAGRQLGLVKRSGLIAAGVSAGAIEYRVSTGRLHALHRGIYLVGHPVPSPATRQLAAVLACGPVAGLSHRSATVLWSLLPERPGPLDVSHAGSRRRAPASVRLHARSELDLVVHQSIPVTTPTQTLLDLAASDAAAELERAVEEALASRLVTRGELLAAMEPGRPGVRRLRAVLATGPTFTRSEAERRLRALLGRARLPPARTNVRLGGKEVDAVWPDSRVVVEVDSFRFHGSRAAFERDRRRDAELQAAGYRVIRVTWRHLTEEPEALIASLAASLARSAPSG